MVKTGAHSLPAEASLLTSDPVTLLSIGNYYKYREDVVVSY